MPRDRESGVGLVDRVASSLRQRILTGDLPAGSHLPSETELTNEFGVSRTVVREAISRLRAAGVVETHQGRGSFVLDPPSRERESAFAIRTWSDLTHLMELRIGAESEASALAAERLDPVHRAELDAAMHALEASAARPERFVELDFAFHLAVAEASGNPYLVELLHNVGPRAIMLHRSQLGDDHSVRNQSHLELLVHEHRSIHQAIVRRDADAARAAMRVHLRRSLAALRAAIWPDGSSARARTL